LLYRWLGGSEAATGQYERLEEVRRISARYGVRGRAAYFHLEMAHLMRVFFTARVLGRIAAE